MEGDVLSYASSPPPRRRAGLLLRHFHVWVLPLVWLPGAWGSRVHYGDEFIGFGMANLPGAFIAIALSKVIGSAALNQEWVFEIIVAAGFVLWAGVGWLLDRLRAWKWVYLLMPVAFVAIATSRLAVPGHVPPIADYPGQQWEWPAVFVAYCWAVYLVALATLLGATVAAAGRACLWWTRGVASVGAAPSPP